MRYKTIKLIFKTHSFIWILGGLGLIFNFIICLRYLFGKPDFSFFLFHISIFGLAIFLLTVAFLLEKIFDIDGRKSIEIKNLKKPISKESLKKITQRLSLNYHIKTSPISHPECYKLLFHSSPYYLIYTGRNIYFSKRANEIIERALGINLSISDLKEDEKTYFQNSNGDYKSAPNEYLKKFNKSLRKRDIDFRFYSISDKKGDNKIYFGMFVNDFKKLQALKNYFEAERGYFPNKIENEI